MTDLLIVGAGPAGRALAHRGRAHGLSVTLVDPDPDRVWTATVGVFADDLPGWLDETVIACTAPHFVVYTPRRRVIERRYCVLSPARLQAALTLDGVVLERQLVSALQPRQVRLADGRTVSARQVIDARGGWGEDPALPRQRAFGSVQRIDDGSGDDGSGDFGDGDFGDGDEMVLMDWRCTPEQQPSFSYRVALGDGTRLVEETCLAGHPAPSLAELERRNAVRYPEPGSGPPERVDFPLYLDRAPWRRAGAVRFGAGGGLMHPATGYSIAASLGVADGLAAALAAGADPGGHLWPAEARWTHRLRMLGLEVLLGFHGSDLRAFFDAFFTLPVPTQRAYLSDRTSVRGTAGAMWAVFAALTWRRRMRLLGAVLAATAGPVIRRWPSRRREPSPDPAASRGPAAGGHRPR